MRIEMRALRNIKRKHLIAGAIIVALLGGGSFVAKSLRTPEPLKDLEAAGEAGDDAQAQTKRIIENLEDISSNLEKGSDLSEDTSSIHDLTERQRASLRGLIGVLKEQLRALERTQATLSQTEEAATGVAELGERQKEVIGRSVAALRRLQGYIEDATRRSARFAQQAIYGARLAEDSRKHFRP
jgi:methyl-accepting chemotaxis protein